MKRQRLILLLAVALLQILDIQAQSLSERVIILTEAVIDTTITSKTAQPTGQKTQTLGRMTLQSGRSRDLGEVLAANSSIYIKSMGRGSLATASIRGTSSNHTQVLWNGMPINSSMVGSFDFSTIPTFFLDQITLALGAADSRGVSGVLGGTIRLESVAAQNGAETLIEYGSNNTQTYGISAGYKLGTVSMSTRVWLQSSDNDFKFLNNVLSKEPFYARRTDSDYSQGGVMQQFATQVGQTTLKADFWAMWGERSLPQPIVVSHTSSESQNDLSIRSTLSASRQLQGGQLDIRTSWLHENLRYLRDMGGNGDQYNKNVINTFIIDGNYAKQVSSKFKYEFQIQGRADITDAQNLNREKIDRYTIGGGINTNWQPLNQLKVGVSAKISMFDDLVMPSGNVGIEWQIVNERLTLSSNVAYNYHAPTLNDLYWQPGGNPELNPEHGLSQDITLKWQIPTSVGRFILSATRFRMDIEDWIVWTPTESYYWSPRNMNRVRSEGVELSAESLFHLGNLTNRIVFNYCNTDASNRRASFKDDASVGMQLPYVPHNKWNINLTSQYKTLIFNYYCGYTGKRYTTTDQSYSTNDYNLHSASIEWSTPICNHNLTLRFSVDNLFDTYWESTQYYPQPLRTFNIKAIFKLNAW